MMQQFKSMNELVEYLGQQDQRTAYLEQRIKHLEEENQRLRALPASSQPVDKETIARYVAALLPQTNIIHPSFVKRALAVWGHYFVVQFVIGLVVGLVYCLFVFLMLSSLQQGVR